MKDCAKNLEFEEAAQYRDQIKSAIGGWEIILAIV
jgi:excinuclease UvrABC nuclease subunit